MPKYEVPVIYRGQSNFIVEAATPEQAKARAEEQYKNGENAVLLGNEWEDVEQISEPVLIALRESLVIDGTNADGELAGDGTLPPFFVFDPNIQQNVAGPFQTRENAQERLLNLRGIEELDKLHGELEIFTGQQEPFYDDLFNRVGCIVAMLKGEYDPDETGGN